MCALHFSTESYGFRSSAAKETRVVGGDEGGPETTGYFHVMEVLKKKNIFKRLELIFSINKHDIENEWKWELLTSGKI